MSNQFIGLEDEIQLRLAIKAVYKHEGMPGIFQVMGELARSLEIVGEVAEEMIKEENKNNGGGI